MSFPLLLNVKKACVITRCGTDKIILELDVSSPFPNCENEPAPIISLECQKGYGFDYCNKVLGVAACLIDKVEL